MSYILTPCFVLSLPKNIAEEETGQRDTSLVDAERAFGQAFQEKMNAGKAKKKALAASSTSAWANPVPVVATSWKALTSVAPSLDLTTSNLNHLRNSAKGKLGRMITVNIMPMVGGSHAIWLSDISNVFHSDTPVGGILFFSLLFYTERSSRCNSIRSRRDQRDLGGQLSQQSDQVRFLIETVPPILRSVDKMCFFSGTKIRTFCAAL